ncbi:MAG: HAD family hydrolase [Clostridium sp.]|jgi:Cof subfamily protein (haloacid dehalogenase superfamily)|nr:HAD family phosphatase [Clostridium sp.]
MIKLIATDMDGTLLDEKGNLPKDFFHVFHRLKENGVKFVVASGRPYYTLYDNFKPISDELYYICDNGSYVAEENKKPQVSIIDKDKIREIIKACEKIPNITIILCGIKGAYHMGCEDNFLEEIDKYYIKKYVVDDLNNIEDDIFKVTVCDLNISAENSYPILNELFGEELKVVVSGKLWVDINNKGVNKGYALEKIQKDENISFEETMVFGDFYNDIEMLEKAYYSFVMKNANEDMKKYGNFIAESNSENGVIKAIEKYVFKA